MALADRVFLLGSARAVARAARAHVRPKIRDGVGAGFGSVTLSKNVEIRPHTGTPGRTKLYIDHYWALYVHDGRGPIPGPPRGGGEFFVWYHDRRDDPRLSGVGGYPRRYREVGKLSKAEFIRDKKAGKLVFVRDVHKGVPPSPFFSNDPGGGMFGFLAGTAMPLMRARWARHIKRRLQPIRNIVGQVEISLS